MISSKTILLAVLGVGLATVLVGGHEEAPAPAAIEEQQWHAPSVLPDRILLTWSGDPAHTQDVSWRTSTEVKQAYLEYAVATPGPNFRDNSIRLPASTLPFESDLSSFHFHHGRMAALAPSVKYVYRVGDGTNWSEWFQFTTASDQPKPFSFIYFGDAQNDIRSMWSRVIREAQADAPRASFMLHAGDLVNRANRDAEWGEWFGAGAWLNAMIPSVATPGNHEYGQQEGTRALSRYWRPTFAFPSNGPPGLEETAYWFDYQGVRMVSLNSNERHEEQAVWLEQVLATNPCRWTIVTFHHPLFSSAAGRDNAELRSLWKPVLDKHKVDLVLQGHDHTYARTGLDVPENLAEGVNVKRGATVYVVSVSGPKQYQRQPQPFFQRAASGAQLYQIIRIDGDVLRYEARLAHGLLYDAFELHKQPGERNRLVDKIPPTPELLKPLWPIR